MTHCRVLIADDHQLVRAGLRLLLSEMAGIEVVGEAGNGEEACTLCQATLPDLILMDIAMPLVGGLAALARIRGQHPTVCVIMLSMLDSEEHVLEAFRQGAAGYLLKDAAPAELELAIHAALRGDTWLSAAITRPVVDCCLMRADGSSTSPLSHRQRQVLRLLAECKSTKEIAFALNISVKTVETHRAQAMQRIGVHDIAGIVRYAIRHGMVSA